MLAVLQQPSEHGMQYSSRSVFLGDEVGLTQAGEALMPGEVKEDIVFFVREEEAQ